MKIRNSLLFGVERFIARHKSSTRNNALRIWGFAWGVFAWVFLRISADFFKHAAKLRHYKRKVMNPSHLI